MTTNDPLRDEDELLDQVEDFVRAGDYAGALARACLAERELPEDAAPRTRARAAWAVTQCEALSRAQHAEDEARSAAHISREQRAIGGEAPLPALIRSAWGAARAWLGRARTPRPSGRAAVQRSARS